MALPRRYRHVRLSVCRVGALGDVLLCTPALRAVKERNPNCRITFHTGYPELIRGLPYIDEVRAVQSPPEDAVALTYEECIPPRRHLAAIIGDHLGVVVTNPIPDVRIDQSRVAHWRASWSGLPRPVIAVNRQAGPWTPNKDWPTDHWAELLRWLAGWATVVEIGKPDPLASCPKGLNYVDLRGQTSLPDLVAVIATADLHVGPISGPVHIAAAVRVPSVVIYGGYEDPVCTQYPGNVSLFTALSCSPCWLKTPCPYDRECLRAISPDEVERAIGKTWDRIRSGSPDRGA